MPQWLHLRDLFARPGQLGSALAPWYILLAPAPAPPTLLPSFRASSLRAVHPPACLPACHGNSNATKSPNSHPTRRRRPPASHYFPAPPARLMVNVVALSGRICFLHFWSGGEGLLRWKEGRKEEAQGILRNCDVYIIFLDRLLGSFGPAGICSCAVGTARVNL